MKNNTVTEAMTFTTPVCPKCQGPAVRVLETVKCLTSIKRLRNGSYGWDDSVDTEVLWDESEPYVLADEEANSLGPGEPVGLELHCEEGHAWLSNQKLKDGTVVPERMGRELVSWNECDLAAKYAQALCKACRDDTCDKQSDEHDLSVYWNLPKAERDHMVQQCYDAPGQDDGTWQMLEDIAQEAAERLQKPEEGG